jgi:hypothetical protein
MNNVLFEQKYAARFSGSAFYKRCLPLSSGAACAGKTGRDFLYLYAQIFHGL